jgi:hypothetical protein
MFKTKILSVVLAALYATDSIGRGWHYSNGGLVNDFVIITFFSIVGIILAVLIYKRPIKTIFVLAILFSAIFWTWFVFDLFHEILGVLAIAPALLFFHGVFELWKIFYPEDNQK